MEQNKFTTLTIEGKLNALYDELNKISSMLNEQSKQPALISKPYYKVSEIARHCGRTYVTIERAVKTLGINFTIQSGVKAIPAADVERVINLVLRRCS